MLFLYRPRQTYMPYRAPRNMVAQTAYNQQMQDRFDATRRVSSTPAAAASSSPSDTVSALSELAQMHASGALDDAEFAAAKAKVLAANDSA